MSQQKHKLQQQLRRFHKLSALILFAFVLAHMLNHVSGVFGIETYNAVQKALRTVYRFAPVEALLLLLVSGQLLLGATLLVRALRRGRPKGFWAWTQILSGGMLFLFLSQHLYAIYMARLVLKVETDFYWPAAVMSSPPFSWYFTPYYFLGVLALFSHIGVGVRYWALDANRPKLANQLGIGFILAGILIGITIILVLSGALFEIPLSPKWVAYLQYYVPSYTPPQ
ncbi:hypothetical protein MNBD_ALPHA06-706 [hydrothermal vent metagenome]|uniref:Succinate dehydrogenase cytochrome b subunit n=1 Tax=hydrothermal vent metagenome TaxID=652676 RepID=A0A3B0RA13_9ZZZZ